MRIVLGFLLLGGVGVVACASRSAPDEGSSESAILNGASSDRQEVVLLSNGSFGCSGTLIARDVVMTAAHCSDYRSVYVGYSKSTTDANTQLGEPGPDDTWRRYDVAERVDMPGFQNAGCPMTGGPDVALLRLKQPVQGVPLATLAARAPKPGDECLVVGYGRHNADDNLATNEEMNRAWTYGERRQARVTIYETNGIVIGDGGADAATDAASTVVEDAGDAGAGPAPSINWFSAKGIDGAHSRGDSGGAIFCGGKLAGVVSCSPDRNRAVLDLVKVYGNIEAARSFVDETMRRWRETPLPVPDAGDADGG